MVSAAQGSIKMYQVPKHPNQRVFRTYDIRGEVSDESINADLAYAIGLAVGNEAKAQGRESVIVGRDGRLSGPELVKALIAGLCDSGCNVIDIGLVPTPLVYYATNVLSSDTGVMLTASHNPGHHNGFKIVMAGKTLSTAGVANLYRRIAENDLQKQSAGTVSSQDIIETYIQDVCERIQLKHPLKIVIDCGNGIAGVVAPRLYRQLGCEVIDLFCEVDGHFPNHHPDPTVLDNLSTLIDTVKKQNADIGLGFDGDGDRIGVVTNQGEVIWPDRQMMLFAEDVLTRVPGADIVFDVKCTGNLAKVIAAHGGKPIMYKTGHSILKAKMLEIGAPLAGEMSGHVFFKEGWFGFDDGLYVGARLLRILSEQSDTVSDVFAALPDSVNTPELKLPMPEEQKADFMQRLLSDGDFGDAERITIDGLRVEFDFGWGLVRPSNTSPYLIVRFEADTEANLKALKNLFRAQLLKIDAGLQLPF